MATLNYLGDPAKLVAADGDHFAISVTGTTTPFDDYALHVATGYDTTLTGSAFDVTQVPTGTVHGLLLITVLSVGI